MRSTKALSTTATSTSAFNESNPLIDEMIVKEVIKEDLVPGPFETKNYVAAAAWASLWGFAFLLAPGEWFSASNNALNKLLISHPFSRPESVNEYWYVVYYSFSVVQALIATLEAPVGRGQRLPAAPFLWGSVLLGYFLLGLYFATRTARTEAPDVSELGFASKNIFESKICAGLLAAAALSILFTSDVFTADPATTWAGFTDLLSGSKFVSCTCLDISIMTVLVGVLVSEDASRRGWEDKAVALQAATTLLPVVGPSLYLLARPSLKREE